MNSALRRIDWSTNKEDEARKRFFKNPPKNSNSPDKNGSMYSLKWIPRLKICYWSSIIIDINSQILRKGHVCREFSTVSRLSIDWQLAADISWAVKKMLFLNVHPYTGHFLCAASLQDINKLSTTLSPLYILVMFVFLLFFTLVGLSSIYTSSLGGLLSISLLPSLCLLSVNFS